jgi:glycerol-1-phosphatase
MQDTLATLHDVALLDLDGVVYIGEEAVPGAVDAIESARAAGLACAFVTNNASRTPADVAAHLAALGVPASPEDVVTSAQAGARVLADACGTGTSVLAVGGEGVATALRDVGLVVVRTGEAGTAGVVGVLQGFGPRVNWEDLAEAALAVQRGAMWVVTNPDLTLPVPGGRAPGNGSLAYAVETAAGRGPDVVAGKPFPALMRESVQRVSARAPIAVGDRLDTDIEGAVRAGIPSLLVLTGITDVAGLLAAAPGQRPDFIGADLHALTQAPAPTGGSAGPRRAGEWWGTGSAWASTLGGVLRLRLEGRDWLAGLQSACAATWAETGPVDFTAAAAALEEARRTVGP